MKNFFYFFVSCFFIISIACSQDHKDTLRTFDVDAVIVTADRVENTVLNTTSSVSVLSSKEIRALPMQKSSDLFSILPGFFVVNKDGLGREPIVNTRGFYGGGEAEYVQVLVDGKKVNDLETGLVNWNLVPLHSISCVEVSRGGSSPLYGDAALGGVINIITRKENSVSTNLFFNGGSFNSYNAGFKRAGLIMSQPYQLFLSNERTKGFRRHSEWEGTTFGGDVYFSLGKSSSLKLTGINQWTNNDDPGVLTAKEYDADNTYSSPYYKADGSKERRNQLQAHYTDSFSDGGEFSAKLFYNHKSANVIRTFTNPVPILDFSYNVVGLYDTTEYGDTKERDLRTHEGGLELNYNTRLNIGEMANRFVVGSDLNLGNARSLYFSVFGGFEDDYRNSNLSRNNSALVNGAAGREKYSLYFSDEVQVADPVKFTFGLRWDEINDKYNGESPDTTMSIHSSAMSPKAGINYHFIDKETYSGSIYLSYNNSFKAPTIDQLSDQRTLDTKIYINGAGFFPYPVAPFSNVDLKPQRGTSYEIGTYQRIKFSESFLGELSLSLFQMDMTDEIDFDLATLRYQNIQESKHQGIETGIKLYWSKNFMTFTNYTLNQVTFSAGQYEGNFLKGIPRHVISLGVSYQEEGGVSASIIWNILRDMYLDDANTEQLSNYNPLNAKIAYSYEPFQLFVEANNLLNQRFASTGYILNGVTYLYPAAERSIRGGVELEF